MISFAPYRPAREVRQSYTDQQVAAAVATANGTAASGLTATVEAAGRLWESAFSAGRSTELEPWQLGLIGRELLLHGQSVWWRSGRSGLLPVSDHDVKGRSASPQRWTYRLTLPAPDTTLQRQNVAADRVLHVRIGATRQRPWRGCSPLANAGATRAVLEQVERSLDEEHRGPVGNVIGVPDPEGSQPVADEIGKLGGRAILAEATELDLPGEGQSGRTSWKPNRIGPDPAATTPHVREGVERSLLAAGGVPTELVLPSSAGEGREAWRRFLFATIAPAAGLVSAELRRLGLDPEIRFEELRASDLAGRARAYKQLREAGMEEAEARRVTGFA